MATPHSPLPTASKGTSSSDPNNMAIISILNTENPSDTSNYSPKSSTKNTSFGSSSASTSPIRTRAFRTRESSSSGSPTSYGAGKRGGYYVWEKSNEDAATVDTKTSRPPLVTSPPSFRSPILSSDISARQRLRSGSTEYVSQAQHASGREIPVVLSSSKKAVCAYCHKGFQCDSLKRKHEARHTKPYKCPLSDCERSQKGFTSKNDLTRHLNSVHKGCRGNGSVTGYNCMYGPCKDKKKIYYRLDNFRNHLKKLHAPKDGTAEEFIRRAESDCRQQEGLPAAMDWNMETASEAGSVSVSGPISVSLGRTTIMSEPSVSGSVSVWSRTEDHWTHPMERPRDLEQRPGDTAQEPMDIDTDLYTSSVRGQDESSRIFNLERITSQRNQERDQRIQDIRDEIRRLSKELEALELEKEQEQRPEDTRLSSSYSSFQTDAIRRYVEQSGKEEPNTLARFTVEISPKSTPETEQASHAHVHSRNNENEQGGQHPFALPPSRKPPTPPATTIESPTQENRPRMTDDSNSVISGNIGQRPSSPARSIVEVIPPVNLGFKPARDEPSQIPQLGKAGPEAALERSSKKPGPTKKYPCEVENCHSSFHLPCELRKHKKRHSRPFGCTFRNCPKTFGSKNDWKRHENSQHHKLDEWKCDIELERSASNGNGSGNSTPKLCGKLSYRKENFVNHLKSQAHGLTKADEIERKAKDCYIGAASHCMKFWCGFCVDSKSKKQGAKIGVKSWDERFDHLAIHFEKGSTMTEFVHDDADQYSDFSSSLSDYEEGIESPLGNEPSALVSNEQHGEKSEVRYSGEEETLEQRRPALPSEPDPLQQSKLTAFWYCCNPQGTCTYAGPFIVENCPRCITCEHRKCDICKLEHRA